MENADLERWIGEQMERIDALRKSLCALRRPELERYLAPALVQPFFYYMREGNGGEAVTLVLEEFLDEERFRALLSTMKQMGFRYTGNGLFEGQRFEGIEGFAEAHGMRLLHTRHLEVNNSSQIVKK